MATVWLGQRRGAACYNDAGVALFRAVLPSVRRCTPASGIQAAALAAKEREDGYDTEVELEERGKSTLLDSVALDLIGPLYALHVL